MANSSPRRAARRHRPSAEGRSGALLFAERGRLRSHHCTPPALSGSQLAGLVQVRPETLARVVASSGWSKTRGKRTRRIGVRRNFHAGDVLDELDAPRGHVNQVAEGQLQVALAGVDKRQVSVQTLGAGDLFGVAGLVGLPPSGLRALALSDGAVRTLAACELLEAIATEPSRLVGLARQLGMSLMRLERQLSLAATRTARERLVAHLRELERQAPEASHWLSHASLARRIGSSRETVTRALRVLEQDGVITRDGRRVRLNGAQQMVRPGVLIAQSTFQEAQRRRRVHDPAWDRESLIVGD